MYANSIVIGGLTGQVIGTFLACCYWVRNAQSMTNLEFVSLVPYGIVGGLIGIVIAVLLTVLVWYIGQVICIRRFYKMSKEAQRERELGSK